ncbi:MAG: NfeD family protein [Chloroflexota bacterium]
MGVRHELNRRMAAALLWTGAMLILAAGPAAGGAAASSPGAVVVLPTTGEVDGLMASTLRSAIDSAARDRAAAVVIKLNTPGGSLQSTQDIVTTLLDSLVPVIVWVAPSGGFAASGGTFITLAANLAYMAPGTRIGAASPIDSNGDDIPGTLGQKVKNDAVAFITSIAQVRHRPTDWAASTVSDARSSPAEEAVSLGAVDGIASTIEDVIHAANGKTVTVAGRPVALALTGASIEQAADNPFGGIVRLLVDPNIAFILFVIGVLALMLELQSPSVLAGVFGVVAIVLAFVGFLNLPTNVAGLVLLAIGLGLFGLEPTIPSHGLLTVGGVIAVVLGGSILYTQPGTVVPDVRVALPLILVAAATGAVFAILIAAAVIRVRRIPPPAGAQPNTVPVGTVALVHRPLMPLGSIRAAGEEWSARTADERPLERGAAVRVVGVDGLTAIVEPAPDATPAASNASPSPASSQIPTSRSGPEPGGLL